LRQLLVEFGFLTCLFFVVPSAQQSVIPTLGDFAPIQPCWELFLLLSGVVAARIFSVYFSYWLYSGIALITFIEWLLFSFLGVISDPEYGGGELPVLSIRWILWLIIMPITLAFAFGGLADYGTRVGRFTRGRDGYKR